jgi:hypothetical protein
MESELPTLPQQVNHSPRIINVTIHTDNLVSKTHGKRWILLIPSNSRTFLGKSDN